MRAEALQMLSTGQTPAQVADALGINPATVRVWKSRANTDKAKRPTETAHPKQERPAVVKKNLTTEKPAAKNRDYRLIATLRKIATRVNALDALLIGIVIGHAGLIWYDCGVQWLTPGVIGGGLAFAIILAALILASDSTKNRTSEAALYFVLLVDGAAWWVHYPTFQQYAGIGNVETGMFAGFLCLCSWFALFLFRDSKLG